MIIRETPNGGQQVDPADLDMAELLMFSADPEVRAELDRRRSDTGDTVSSDPGRS